MGDSVNHLGHLIPSTKKYCEINQLNPNRISEDALITVCLILGIYHVL